jgi:hypothetical protein
MKKDFVTITPDTGGGSATPQVTADANVTAQSRSTTLNFDANGKQLKSVQVNQLGIPWFINVCTAIQGEITKANTNVGHLLKEVDFSPSGDGGSMQNIPFFQYDFEISNFNYTNRTAWYLALEANILGTLIDTNTEYLILEWDLGKGDGWERMEFMWENTFEGYQYWRNTTPNVYPNEYPTVKTVQMRVGIGDNTDPEPIHTYLAQFTVNIILSPRP